MQFLLIIMVGALQESNPYAFLQSKPLCSFWQQVAQSYTHPQDVMTQFKKLALVTVHY